MDSTPKRDEKIKKSPFKYADIMVNIKTRSEILA